jgi:hypothetical protein
MGSLAEHNHIALSGVSSFQKRALVYFQGKTIHDSVLIATIHSLTHTKMVINNISTIHAR